MPGGLSGRVAVVTGAAGGLGVAIVRRLSAEGAAVAALDIADPDHTLAEVGSTGPGPVRAWRCDVADADRVAAVIAEVRAELGAVDVLVNNAGLLSGRAGFEHTTAQDMHRYFGVNAVGALHLTQACLADLLASRHRGRVVNVASRTAFTGAPGQLAYVASKGALVSMTRVLARELGEHGITVNAVMPAQVPTPGTRAHSTDEVFERTRQQQAIREEVTPQHFAGLIAYLAGDDGELMTGQSLVYDGGGLLR